MCYGKKFCDISEAKLANLLNYATSDEFTDAEKAVVALALAAGAVQNESMPSHFDALQTHFSQRQIVQIVAVMQIVAVTDP